MPRYRVSRRLEANGVVRWVSVGTRDADSPEDAKRKMAYNANLPLNLLKAEEIGPALGPVGEKKL